jgi:hypothetical protein
MMAVTLVLVASGGLAACGGTSTSSKAAAAAQGFVDGLQQHDTAKACSYADPSSQAECKADLGKVDYKASNVKLGKTVVQGQQALVTILGTFCVQGQCHTYTNPDSGLPNSTTTFAQAFKTAQNSSDDAANPLVEQDGHWYADLS